MKEIWKPIKDYDNYLVSNFGRVKSIKFNKEVILKTAFRGEYLSTGLFKDGKKKTFSIHKLVAIAFLNHVPNGHKEVIDHLDRNKLNNSVTNLQIVTSRENSTRSKKKKTSSYTGVYWNKHDKKWISCINVNGKDKILGRFKLEDEILASELYQKSLLEL
jgi:hypothetical protein